jgi:flagellar protein FliJ
VTRFKFRLQKVLEYRERLEQDAKDAYLDARAKRLEAEVELVAIGRRRQESLRMPLDDLASRQAMELYMFRLDDEERQQTLVIEALETDEESLRLAWIERRREHEAISKLRDHAYDEWQLEAGRKEQADLDEWAVLRSAA